MYKLKKILFHILAFFSLLVTLFLAGNVFRHKPLTLMGSEKITILSLDPGTDLELTWAYAYDTDDPAKKVLLRDIGFGEIDFSGTWEKSAEGLITSDAGGTLLYQYPLLSSAGYVFCFRVTGGQAILEHTLPGFSETITLPESGTDIIAVCGLYNDSPRYLYPVYGLCGSLLITVFFFCLCRKERNGFTLPDVKQDGMSLQFRLLIVIGIVLSIAGHGSSRIPLGQSIFPVNSLYAFLFVFAAGYFYEESSEQHIPNYLWELTKKLLIPLYGWNFVYVIFTALLSKAGFSLGEKPCFSSLFLSPIYSETRSGFMSAVWFAAPLFIIEAGMALFRKLIGKSFSGGTKEKICLILSLLLGMSGILFADSGLNSGWGRTGIRILCLIPFYSAGFLYKKYLEKRDTISHGVYLASVIGAYWVFYGIKLIFPQIGTFWELLLYPFILGFLEIAFWLRVTRILASEFEAARWINLIAGNAFSILIHQFFGFFLANTVYAVGKIISDSLYPDFVMANYYQDAGYIYVPRAILLSKLNYLIAAIGVGILIKLILDGIHSCPVLRNSRKD